MSIWIQNIMRIPVTLAEDRFYRGGILSELLASPGDSFDDSNACILCKRMLSSHFSFRLLRFKFILEVWLQNLAFL